MDRKNLWAAALLPFLLGFCGAVWAMDYPGMPQQGELVAKEDSGVKAIDLANQYFEASSDEDKSRIVGLLSVHLDRIVADDSEDKYLRASVYNSESNWISNFQTWRLSPSDNDDEKIKKFKNNIYNSYYRTKDKNFICAALQKAAQGLQRTQLNYGFDIENFYLQDILSQLLLLSEKLPYRKNKINKLVEKLKQSRLPIQELNLAIKQMCENEKSMVETAQAVMADQQLQPEEKKQKLQGLYKESQDNIPKLPLLLALKNEDIKALEAIINTLSTEQAPLIEGVPVADWLQNVELTQAKNLVKDIGLMNPDASPIVISIHFKKTVSVIQRLKSVQSKNPNDQEISKLLKNCRNQLNIDAGIITAKLVAENALDKIALTIFPITDSELGKYFNQFMWKKLEKTPFINGLPKDKDYFEKFAQFLQNIRMLNDPSVTNEYKDLLYSQAILAIVDTITSDPVLPQFNYFGYVPDLKPYKDLEDRIHELNITMYDADRLDQNIATLADILKHLKKVEGFSVNSKAGNYYLNKRSLFEKYWRKVSYFEAVLSLWRKFNLEEEIKLVDFIWVEMCFNEYGSHLNEKDLAKIQELMNHHRFTEFIASGSKDLEGKKISVRVLSQAQHGSLIPAGQHLPHDQPVQQNMQQGRRQENRGALQPAQEAPRDNNQPQDWWTKLSIALSELMKTISRIWRSVFG